MWNCLNEPICGKVAFREWSADHYRLLCPIMKILHYLHDKKKLPVYLLFFLYIGHNTKYTMNTHNHVFLGGVVELILGKGGGGGWSASPWQWEKNNDFQIIADNAFHSLFNNVKHKQTQK